MQSYALAFPVQRGDVAYSRLCSLNCWMFRWCSKNNAGFVDIWSSFKDKASLLELGLRGSDKECFKVRPTNPVDKNVTLSDQ